MMKIINCKNCGGCSSGITVGSTAVSVYFSEVIKCCELCNNITIDKNSDYFCSKDCFIKYLKNYEYTADGVKKE